MARPRSNKPVNWSGDYTIVAAFAQQISLQIHKLGLTQDVIANRAKISRRTLVSFLSGKQHINLTSFARLVKAVNLNLTIHE